MAVLIKSNNKNNWRAAWQVSKCMMFPLHIKGTYAAGFLCVSFSMSHALCVELIEPNCCFKQAVQYEEGWQARMQASNAVGFNIIFLPQFILPRFYYFAWTHIAISNVSSMASSPYFNLS